MKLPADTGFDTLSRSLLRCAVWVIDEFATLPLTKLISSLILGWSGLLGALDACSSFGKAQLHMVAGETHPLFSTTASGCAIVEIPVGIGGYPVKLSH